MNQDLITFDTAVNALIDSGNVEGALSAVRAMTETVLNDIAATGTVLRSPVLDALCLRIGSETLAYLKEESLLPPQAELQAEVIILATELHSIGGHSRVIEDIIASQPEKRHLILLTDFFATPYELDLTRLQKLGVEVRRAKDGNHTDRLLWTQMQLACHPGATVMVFNHHADAAAISALQPGVNHQIVFCHHADHQLCLGASLGHVRHVDLFETHCLSCRAAGLDAVLWPLSVSDIEPRPQTSDSFRSGGILVTASCGHEGKFLAPYPFHYWDILPHVLKTSGGKHIHIGYLPDDVLEAIRAGLAAEGISELRFDYIPSVDSLAETLKQSGVDLYIGSFPQGGGRALVEAMSAGIPVVTHAHSLQAMLGSGGLGPKGTWCWSSPQELLQIVASASAEELAERSRAGRLHYQAMHASAAFKAAVCGQKTFEPETTNADVARETEPLAAYLLRSQLRTETFSIVFELLDEAGNQSQGHPSSASDATSTASELLQQARKLITKRDYVGANALLMRAIEQEPENAFVMFELGRLAFLGKMPKEGYDILTEAANMSHAVLPDIMALGEQFVRDGNPEHGRIILSLLRTITNETRPSGTPEEGLARIRALSDHEWMEVLCRSPQEPNYHGFKLPGFPDEQFQINTMGSSNGAAMREAALFYRATQPFLSRMRPLAERTYLDFGTGWGRFARTFLKVFEPQNIYGADVDPYMIKTCTENFGFGNFSVCPSFPPTDFNDNQFDLITAYSVFSHLSAEAADAWFNEFARILRPGGFVAFTTQGRAFIAQCAYYRKTQSFTNDWHKQLAASFVDEAACYAAYDAGELLFAPTGAGPSDIRTSSFYGETMIPAGYMIRKWSEKFDLLTFIDDISIMPQAFAVLRKK